MQNKTTDIDGPKNQASRNSDSRLAAEAARRQRRRRRRWAVFAVLFPLFFFVVIAIGLAAMYYRHMEIFRPPRVGAVDERHRGADLARAQDLRSWSRHGSARVDPARSFGGSSA